MEQQGRGEVLRFGAKVRAFRRRENLTQVQLAQRLGISASYLNLIEANRRPLPASLLIKLAQVFRVDLHSFAADEDARLVADLFEAFADPLFESEALSSTEVREMATASPSAARAVLTLYRAYQAAQQSTEHLSARLSDDQELTGVDLYHLPSEQVSDLIQRHMNHFPELEEGAEKLWRDAKLDGEELYPKLIRHLEKELGVSVRIARRGSERGTLRRFDQNSRTLSLSELLPTRSRQFQLAHQIGLLTQTDVLRRLTEDPQLTNPESRALARVALANYFAGALLMPYANFLQAAREERYDIDVIGRRFRMGFEQVSHRLTTLRRPGAEGVPFHMIRIDVAGNISKRFTASGIRFPRFSGVCARWNIFAAFLTPGMIRIQLSRMEDGTCYFCIARTVHRDSGGYRAVHPVQAIGLGCRVSDARALVYSDGVDLDHLENATPVGITCRICDRTDCEQRTLPSLRHPLQVDENVRGVSLYNPAAS
jgi:predicted transcriptional regulator/DNA-binding XRE family transcriptional regulator